MLKIVVIVMTFAVVNGCETNYVKEGGSVTGRCTL